MSVLDDAERAYSLLVAVANESDATKRRQYLEAAEFACKWALRGIQDELGYVKTTDAEHTCRGLVDDYRVYRDEDGDWRAEIVPGDWLLVTHCPWCGTFLERRP